MINVIRSDFYKLFRMKSFYICGLLSGIFGVLSVMLLDVAGDFLMIGKDPNGINSITYSMGDSETFATIFLSLLVASEFSHGTIKNMVSRGISKVNIYLSKIIVGIFTVITYSLTSILFGFICASIKWGVGEYNQNEFLEILKMFGLYILAAICLESMFIMIAFVVRNTGGTIAVNLVLLNAIAAIIFPVIDLIAAQWDVIHRAIDSSAYWVGTYTGTFAKLGLEQYIINRGIIVCLSYFVISTIIGIVTFYKKDIQ